MSASLLHHLTGLGGFTIGQILMTPIEGGRFELRHTDDAALSVGDLESFSDPLSARQIAHYNAAGEYRPLKGTPDLRTGWRLELNGAEALRTALDTFYPAALALWTAHRENRLRVLPLSETLDRQTGMYRYARTISPEGAEGLTQRRCREGCSRKPLWADGADSVPQEPGILPLLCPEACSFFVAEARNVAKAEFEAKATQSIEEPAK